MSCIPSESYRFRVISQSSDLARTESLARVSDNISHRIEKHSSAAIPSIPISGVSIAAADETISKDHQLIARSGPPKHMKPRGRLTISDEGIIVFTDDEDHRNR